MLPSTGEQVFALTVIVSFQFLLLLWLLYIVSTKVDRVLRIIEQKRIAEIFNDIKPNPDFIGKQMKRKGK
jgi:hypothetical protein